LIRPGAEPAFRLECWRSFARYVHDFLIEAARDCPPLGDAE
jgi:sarcosine oxidase, subunit gamma